MLDFTAADAARLWPLVAALFGLIIGSFANVCIHRLPLGESVVAPPSRCPRCGAPLRWWDNLPLVSFAVLRGRCRQCSARISARYPLVEAANAALWFLLAQSHGPSVRGVATLAFATALLVLAAIDLEHQLLPDLITLPGILLGIALSFAPASPVPPLESVVAAVGGYVAFMCVATIWKRLRGIEALGQGDWKFAAMLGAFLGWQPLLLTVMLATCVGSVVGGLLVAAGRGHAQTKLPLGTFLGLAGIVVLFVGDPVISWYGELLRA
jgi:leader peptidase (prepilin peptidase)/N-methyltransferase